MNYRLKIVTLLIILYIFGSISFGESNIYIPSPEEIYEAFENDLLEYNDYIELLEIVRKEYITSADSQIIAQYPDLIAGFSSNPYIEVIPAEISKRDAPKAHKHEKTLNQSVLFRQYHKLEPNQENQRLLRYYGIKNNLEVYGEWENSYAGNQRWLRRYAKLTIPGITESQSILTLGNYKEKFSMGLIYGYHGQLLSKPSERDELEKFLLPNYGGSNGALLSWPIKSGIAKIIFDYDRNESFREFFTGISIPLSLFSTVSFLSGAHGRVVNRGHNNNTDATYLSLGFMPANSPLKECEFALAYNDNKLTTASAIKARWDKGSILLNINGWHYDNRYPSFFAGGPSSRRSRTLYLDDMDFSYSDRYAGEIGGAVNSTYSMTESIQIKTSLGYAERSADDNRLEAKTGFIRYLSENYTAKLNCYWRYDNLYSTDKAQRRVQFEVNRIRSAINGRLVIGYYFDRYYNRNDCMLLAETRVKDRFGKLHFLIKLDRIRLTDIKNNYIYATVSHETTISKNISSYIRYGYRYRADYTDERYVTLRWDINWRI
ncbi:MAG: hypothetical protein V3V99_12120 [candidate division Zixibacteria bacterium]